MAKARVQTAVFIFEGDLKERIKEILGRKMKALVEGRRACEGEGRDIYFTCIIRSPIFRCLLAAVQALFSCCLRHLESEEFQEVRLVPPLPVTR